METKGKSRGFMKGKLTMSFYKAAKPSSPAAPYSSSRMMKPSPTTLMNSSGWDQHQLVSQPNHRAIPGSAAAAASATTTTTVDFIIKQDQIISTQPKQTVSFFIQPAAESGRDFHKKLEELYGVAGDESVDLKAQSYISTMRERFKLERTNSSDYRKLQDVQV